MTKNTIVLCFLLLALINAATAFKVLAFLPFFASSHNKIGQSIARAIADKGHDVTIISCFPKKDPNRNYKEISTEDFLETFFKGEQKYFSWPVIMQQFLTFKIFPKEIFLKIFLLLKLSAKT